MADKLALELEQNEPPVLVIGGKEYRARMSYVAVQNELIAISEIQANKKELEEQCKGELEKVKDVQNPTPDEAEKLISVTRSIADAMTAPRRLFDKILGEGAYNEIFEGCYNTIDEDLHALALITQTLAIYEAEKMNKAAEERRAKQPSPASAKKRAAKK